MNCVTIDSDEIVGALFKWLRNSQICSVKLIDGRVLDRQALVCELIPEIDKWMEEKLNKK